MKKLVAMAGALLILCGCAPERQSENSYKTNSYFAADHLGIYYVTQERTVRFIPFSEDTAAEYGHEIGLLNGLSDIVSICAESDGNIGTIDAEGMYYTTHNIQPEQSEDFIPDSSGSIGAGSGQLASVAKQFDGLSDIVFFRSSYPSWGLFVHRDGSVTIPVLEESLQIKSQEEICRK